MHETAQRARQLVDETVRPSVREWEAAATYPRQVAAASGLTGLFAPASGGGLDLGFEDGMAVFEELGRGDAAFAFSLSMHNAVASAIARAAPPDVADRWAARLAAGDALGGFSLTEPHAGSDATAITTLATETGDGWRIDGRKAWVSLAGEADVFLVVCKTARGPGHRDIAVFAVDRRAEGVSFPVLYETNCARFLPIGEMALEGVRGDLVVPAGSGMRAALGAIDVARCDIAAIACGVQAEALEIGLRQARQRQVAGGRLLEMQGVQWQLADLATDLEASRLLVGAAARALGTPEGPVAVAHAKRFSPDAALRAAITASELLGAYGWLDDHDPARLISLAKMLQVVDGTAEIQRIVIARELVRRVDGA
jgi:alkylation response protein AidB-like acyl-CoA dehydrogenase